MAIPNAPLTVQDGGLGIIPPSSERVHLVIGPCTGGTPNTLYSYSGSADQLIADLVSGQAVEAAALSLFTPGNGGVLVMPVTKGVAGSNGSMTSVKAPGTLGTVALTGTPKDDYDASIKFLTGVSGFSNADAADGTLVYTLDGGNTWSDVYALPVIDPSHGAFVIPGTGLTFTVADGVGVSSITAGDTYSWHSTGPGFSSTNLAAALDAALALPDAWNFVHIVGRASNGSGSATIAATVAAKMTAAEAKIRYAFAIVEAADDTDQNLETAFASFSSTRVMVCAGDEIVTSPITGQQSKRSTGWATAARLGAIDISQSAAAVEDGPLDFVTKINRDESATPGLDDARFCTHRTFTGRQGVYVGLDRMMAPAGSDFFFAPLRRVMDRACEVAHSAAVHFLSKKVRTNGKGVKSPLVPGAIAETDAVAIEKQIGNQLRDALLAPGHATEASVKLSRTANLQSNGGSDPLTLRLVAFGYLLNIPINIGYVNPATQG